MQRLRNSAFAVCLGFGVLAFVAAPLPSAGATERSESVLQQPHSFGEGYVGVGSDGGAFAFGDAPFEGSLPNLSITPSAPIVGVATTPDDQGYWMVGNDGNIYAFGDATYSGYNPPGTGATMTGIAVGPTSTGAHPYQQYWEVSSNGGVFAMGGAPFYGSPGPSTGYHFVGIAPTPDEAGYWVVRNDGAIYAYGDAPFDGSVPNSHVTISNVVGIAGTNNSSGWGYDLVGSDGGVFSYGAGGFYGSYGGQFTTTNIVSIAATPDGYGYWLVRSDGFIANFGDAAYLGSMEGVPLGGPIVGLVQ